MCVIWYRNGRQASFGFFSSIVCVWHGIAWHGMIGFFTRSSTEYEKNTQMHFTMTQNRFEACRDNIPQCTCYVRSAVIESFSWMMNMNTVMNCKVGRRGVWLPRYNTTCPWESCVVSRWCPPFLRYGCVSLLFRNRARGSGSQYFVEPSTLTSHAYHIYITRLTLFSENSRG